jgi:hypothetical protein
MNGYLDLERQIKVINREEEDYMVENLLVIIVLQIFYLKICQKVIIFITSLSNALLCLCFFFITERKAIIVLTATKTRERQN